MSACTWPGVLKWPAPPDVRANNAPEFSRKSLDGKTVQLADYKGKAVLLNFWATCCRPCKIEMPWFVDLQKSTAPKDSR